MEQKRFLILGHEPRQIYLKELLEEKKQIVTLSDNYVAGSYDAFLLPVPTSAAYYELIEPYLSQGQFVFGCNIPRPQVTCTQVCEEKVESDVHFVEYMESDEVAYKNAIATAEGAIARAIEAGSVNLHGSKSLVTGFGRCGEILANKLKALNSQVTVMDRSPDRRAKAIAYGMQSLTFSDSEWKAQGASFDFVFNTVPDKIIDSYQLDCLSPQVIIIDIASKPGGVNFKYCEEHKIFASLEAGLPGRYAPKTSAEILLEVIEQSMNNPEV